MQARSSDCVIERTLRDPMTAAIMRADGVDRDALRDILRQAAANVSPRRPGNRIKRALKAAVQSW